MSAISSGAAPAIVAVRASLRHGGLTRPWGADVLRNSVVVVEVDAEDGTSGTGFAWTPTVGPEALLSLIRDDVAPAVLGLPAHPVTVSRHLFRRLHEGGSGLVQAAAAAVDLALWDRECVVLGMPLADRLGRERDTVAAYGSGVNLHYTIDELVAQVGRWVDAGFDAVKVKVGLPDPAEDLDRLIAVREAIGPQRRLMVDANQRWDLATAVRAVRSFDRVGIDWIEEPLRADDTVAYSQLRARSDVPVALGENAHSVYRFRDLIVAGACDIVQPNVIRVGGITPFLRIVDLAETFSIATMPHLLPDLSAQLALTLPRAGWVEDVEDAGLGALGLLAEPSPVQIVRGAASVVPTPGLGLRFTDSREEAR